MTEPLLSLRGVRIGTVDRHRSHRSHPSLPSHPSHRSHRSQQGQPGQPGRPSRSVDIVRGVDLDVMAGEKLGIVGESGSGKSLTVLSVLRLLPDPPVRLLGGSITYAGQDLAAMDEKQLASVRGKEIAMVYQDPMSSLNPLLRVSTQIIETMSAHGVPKDTARRRCREVLHQVGMADPDRVAAAFPHELSGGMLQRVMIAMAVAVSPRVLIADEPTTALDVTIQRQILDLVEALHETSGMAVVWVTHDLGVVAQFVDRVLVMYAGRIVERASTAQLFSRPAHPYTKALIGTLPRDGAAHRSALVQIGGQPPDPARLGQGCPFRDRCPIAVDRCAHEEPPLLPAGEDSVAACWRVEG